MPSQNLVRREQRHPYSRATAALVTPAHGAADFGSELWLQSSGRTLSNSSLRPQLVEERLGVLQIGGVEAFSEPVVDRGEVARASSWRLVSRSNRARLVVARNSHDFVC